MRVTRLAGALAFGLISSLGVAFYAAGRTQGPSELFKQYCVKCHGEDGTGNTPKGKQLKARDFTDPEFQSGKSDKDLIKTVTNGGEEMPAFGKKLSPEEIEGLVKNDVRSFRKK
jgi:mono/diheme cytochrome c family protein